MIEANLPPERRILWDSKKRGGRPDTVQLLKDTWKSWRAEVIFITSNMQGNDEMMEGCREGTFSRLCRLDEVLTIAFSWFTCIWYTLGLLIAHRLLAVCFEMTN